jgi:hypothetical protein
VKKLQTLGMGAVVATAAFALFAVSANAQQPAPAASPAVVKPVAPSAPAAAKAPVTAPAAAKTETKAAPKKAAASTCKGLDETACKANPECGYVVPKAVDAKTGKADAAYCRKTAGVAAKPKPAATPAAAAPAKPAPAAMAKPNAPTTATKQ